MAFIKHSIRYCPFPEEEIIDELLGLLDLDELNDLQGRYPDNVDIKIRLAEYYDSIDDEKMSKQLTRELYASYPNSFLTKSRYFIVFYPDQHDKLHRAEFQKIFKNEIDAIFNDQPLNTVMWDEDYIHLLEMMMVHYGISNDILACDHLFKLIHHYGYEPKTLENAYYLVAEKPLFNPLTLLDFDVDEHERLLTFLEKYTPTNPHYSIIFEVLNNDVLDLPKELIGQLSELDDPEKLREDLLWLLHQSLQRSANSNSIIPPKAFESFLYLLAHYSDINLVEPFLAAFFALGEDTIDELFGDYEISIIVPALTIIFAKHLTGLKEFLTKDPKAEFHIRTTTLFSGLCSSYHHYRSEATKELLLDLYEHYREEKSELLSWLLINMLEYNVLDFEKKIREAYAADLMDKRIFESSADIMLSYTPTNEDFKPEQIAEHGILAYCISNLKEVIEYEEEDEPTVPELIAYLIQSHEQETAEYLEWLDEFDDDMYPEDEDDTPVISLPLILGQKVGRNDPCPCGSGSKYKKCCWNKTN